jgi:hypothetical protein
MFRFNSFSSIAKLHKMIFEIFFCVEDNHLFRAPERVQQLLEFVIEFLAPVLPAPKVSRKEPSESRCLSTIPTMKQEIVEIQRDQARSSGGVFLLKRNIDLVFNPSARQGSFRTNEKYLVLRANRPMNFISDDSSR